LFNIYITQKILLTENEFSTQKKLAKKRIFAFYSPAEIMNKPFLKYFPRFFFSSLWALGIFCLFVFDFSGTTKELPLIPYADKIMHALLFFAQTGILLWELNRRTFSSTNISVGRLFLWSVSLPFLYGALIEFIQNYLPYRGAEFMDLLFDLMGSLAAFACLILIMIWQESKH